MDKYDKAIEFLTDHPEKIPIAWSDPIQYEGGCLFQFATPTGKYNARLRDAGCLTQIHGSPKVMAGDLNPVLVEQIVADQRIPSKSEDITVESLPVFAEWQRRLDKELNRV